MRDMRAELERRGTPTTWPTLDFDLPREAILQLEGDPHAEGRPVESWPTVVLLRVPDGVEQPEFCFESDDTCKRAGAPLILVSRCFLARIGPGAVGFSIRDVNGNFHLPQLVIRTTIGDQNIAQFLCI